MGCKCNVPIGTFTLWHIYKALHLHMQCMQSLRSTYMPKMQPNYTLNWLMFCAIAQAGAAIVVLVLFIACLWSTIAPSYLLKHINTQFTYLPFWMVKRFFFILCIVRFLIKSTDKLVHSSWQWLYFPCIYGIWISNTVKKCWRHHMLCTCFDMVQSTKRILWFYKIFSNVQG